MLHRVYLNAVLVLSSWSTLFVQLLSCWCHTMSEHVQEKKCYMLIFSSMFLIVYAHWPFSSRSFYLWYFGGILCTRLPIQLYSTFHIYRPVCFLQSCWEETNNTDLGFSVLVLNINLLKKMKTDMKRELPSMDVAWVLIRHMLNCLADRTADITPTYSSSTRWGLITHLKADN